MAVITDPDYLTYGVEIVLDVTDPANPTIGSPTAGNVGATDRYSLAVYYSALKLIWKNTTGLPRYWFPLKLYTANQGVFLRNWEPLNALSRARILNGGWAEENSSEVTKREFVGAVSIPADGIRGTDQPYYEHVAGTPTNCYWPGPINEAIKTYETVGTAFDRRTTELTFFCREQGRTYARANILSAYSLTSLGTGIHYLPMSTTADTHVTHTDIQIDPGSTGVPTVAPWSDMILRRNASPVAIAMSGGTYNFTGEVVCAGATIQSAHELCQFLLRQNRDIDAGTGTLNGKCAPQLTSYVGDTLYTSQISSGAGLALTGFAAAGINFVNFTDNTNAVRAFDYTAAFAIEFPAAVQAATLAEYWVYPAATFNSAAAVVVNDASGNPMTGLVSGAASVSHTWTYPGSDLPVVVVVLDCTVGGSQNTTGTATLARSTENKCTIATEKERLQVA